jgi:hypothetical protein
MIFLLDNCTFQHSQWFFNVPKVGCVQILSVSTWMLSWGGGVCNDEKSGKIRLAQANLTKGQWMVHGKKVLPFSILGGVRVRCSGWREGRTLGGCRSQNPAGIAPLEILIVIYWRCINDGMQVCNWLVKMYFHVSKFFSAVLFSVAVILPPKIPSGCLLTSHHIRE